MEKLLVERFEIEESLGHGGMSEVFLARDRNLGIAVALKVLHPHLVSEKVVLERFRREATVARSIHHPGILRIYDLHEDAERGLVFLAMEYCPGGDLKNRLSKNGPLGVPEAIRVGTEALEALGAAHAAGVVHRDIKPHNILFAADGKVRVGDFGLAKTGSLEGLSPLTHIAGTPEYTSPELIEGAQTDARSDIYALGITLFEVLTGRLPFSANSPYETLRMQVEEAPPSPHLLREEIPEPLSRVILKAMAKDPGERYQTAGEFAAALQTLDSQRSVPASAALAVASFECPDCGKSVSRAFPQCPVCGASFALAVRSEDKENRYRVLVTGPGRVGEKLPGEKRFEILKALEPFDVNLRSMEKTIPRLPFILMKDLTHDSATALAGRLAQSGIEALVAGSGLEAENKRARGMLLKKTAMMAPRLFAVIAGMSTGWFRFGSNMGTGTWIAAGVLFGLLILGVPIVTLIAHYRAGVLWKRSDRRALAALFLPLVGRLKRPAFRSLARRLADKTDLLEAELDRLSVGKKEREELSVSLRSVAEKAVVLLGAILDMDEQLSSFDELSLYRELHTAKERVAAGESGAEENRSVLEESLRERQRLETAISVVFDRLLRLSSRLDGLCLDMAALRGARAQELESRLGPIELDLRDEAAALEELSRGGY